MFAIDLETRRLHGMTAGLQVLRDHPALCCRRVQMVEAGETAKTALARKMSAKPDAGMGTAQVSSSSSRPSSFVPSLGTNGRARQDRQDGAGEDVERNAGMGRCAPLDGIRDGATIIHALKVRSANPTSAHHGHNYDTNYDTQDDTSRRQRQPTTRPCRLPQQQQLMARRHNSKTITTKTTTTARRPRWLQGDDHNNGAAARRRRRLQRWQLQGDDDNSKTKMTTTARQLRQWHDSIWTTRTASTVGGGVFMTSSLSRNKSFDLLEQPTKPVVRVRVLNGYSTSDPYLYPSNPYPGTRAGLKTHVVH
ncbi:hypothetical protein EDB83DRAFT_2325890 [Lactarius deliciosus]|nr:hypothetical protein EDB83DRAFT_2325890 [Lactarius deliciosus]